MGKDQSEKVTSIFREQQAVPRFAKPDRYATPRNGIAGDPAPAPPKNSYRQAAQLL
jgi:hypothetical protein